MKITGVGCRNAHVWRSGFALCELLVVIGILGILAGISTLAVAKARAKAQRVCCLNNLMQLQTAWVMYADDYNDRLCPNKSSVVGNWNDPLAWSASPGSWVVGNPQWDSTARNLEAGVLYPYTRSLGIYHCPVDRSFTRKLPKVPCNRSYALDIFLNGTPPLYGTALNTAAQIVAPPSGVFGFVEVLAEMINGCDFAVYRDDRWYDIPTDRHRLGFNLSYVDGHVEYHLWRRAKAHTNIGTLAQAVDDRQDLKWLQERLPGM